MTRILAVTNQKGGVGKTSVSAATAVRLSELGHRTLVLSTDPAHSLSDSFNLQLGAEPTKIKENLHAIEVNPYVDLKQNWHSVQKYYTRIFMAQGVSGVMADEMIRCVVGHEVRDDLVTALVRIQGMPHEGARRLECADRTAVARHRAASCFKTHLPAIVEFSRIF